MHTRESLHDIGGFVYDSNSVSDDLPYYTTVNGQPWLVIPYTPEGNDARFWRGGLVSTEDFYQYMKDSFECLYEDEEGEGDTEDDVRRSPLPHRRTAATLGRSRALPRMCDSLSQG